MRSSNLIPIVLLISLTVLVGCEEPASTETAAPADPLSGVEFSVTLPPDSELVEVWRPYAEEWESRTQASVTLETGEAATSSGMIVFPITDLAKHYSEGKLGIVDPDAVNDAGQELWADTAQGLRDTVCIRKKKVAAIPIACPALVCYYRADLLAAARLKPPETWDEYQQLIDTIDQWAPGLSAVEPWSDDFRATMFLARAVSYARFPGNLSLCFDFRSGRPLISEPGFVQALQDSAKAIKGMPESVLSLSPLECSALVRSGKAALAIGYEQAGSSQSGEQRDSSVVIGFCQLPGQRTVYNRGIEEWSATPDGQVNRPTLTAFAGFCVGFSKEMSTEQQNAAVNLLDELTSEESISVTLPPEMRSLCRMSQEEIGAAVWFGQQLPGDEARMYSLSVIDALRSNELVAELPMIGREQFKASLAAAISKCLTQKADAATVLKELSDEWKTIAVSIGEKEVLNSFRTSFGLSAR